MSPRRSYYKCRECLVPVVIVDSAGGEIACVCGGKLRFMGDIRERSRGAVFVTQHEETVCDDRCTGAIGPSCNCPCGGVNHGTGRTVTVETVQGKVQIVTEDASAQTKRAAELRASLAIVMSLAEGRPCWSALQAYKAQRFVRNVEQLNRAIEFSRALAHARNLGTHPGRLRALAQLQDELIDGEWL